MLLASPAGQTASWVEALDESVADDLELLDWFGASTWWDLSIAMSMAMNADVEFPDREGQPPADRNDDLTMQAYDIHTDLSYPLSISGMVAAALEAYDRAACVRSWRQLADQVYALEGFPVTVGRSPFAARQKPLDDRARPNIYRRRAPGRWTLARWRMLRLAPHLPTHPIVDIDFPDGRPAHGRVLLSTLRRAWNGLAPPAVAPATDPERVFTVMREARWTAYVLAATS